jgi:transposase
VWTLIAQGLKEVYPAKPQGHRRVELRRVLTGLIFRLRTGGQWHQLPKPCGDDRTVPRPFQHWCDLGVCERIWAVLVQAWDALGGVDWLWQAADAARGKARRGGDLVGRHPTDRGQKGESAASWWQPLAGHGGSPWPAPTCMTPSGS